MSKKNKGISTLEYYNYGENYRMDTPKGAYKVKISDKDGNIITIEDDNGLYACVQLSFDPDTGVLKMLDVAHDGAVISDIPLPNAEYIYNCRYDEETNAILFDVKSLYGNDVNTIELNIDDFVEIYEAGKGIEIGEKSAETGRKPISIKLVDGEELLQLTDGGLGLDSKVITDEELTEAISGKADVSYVDEVVHTISGITGAVESALEDIEKIKDILGTDEDDPSIDERIDSKADLDEFNDLEEEVGELETIVSGMSEVVDTFNERISANTEAIGQLETNVGKLGNDVAELSGDVINLSNEIEDNKVRIVKVENDLPENVKEAYVLKNALDEQLGEQINIYYDSSIKSIEYTDHDDSGHTGQFLKIVYIKSTGEEEVSYIDLSSIIIENEFGDGLQVIDGVASVKIDPTSDGYLSVSENGIKLTGVFEFFQQLLEVNSQQWTAITGEVTRAQDVEGQLWTAISNEAATRASEDEAIRESIGEFVTRAELAVEAEERANADEALSNQIIREAERAKARENEIEASIAGAVETEKQRAELVEAALMSSIEEEKTARQSADSTLDSKIDQEIENRQSADTAIRQDVSEAIRGIDARIVGFEDGLSAETEARREGDANLQGQIDSITENYATKAYVDEKDAETLESAVNTSKDYTDTEIDKVENELKEYCDSAHTELQEAISENATKINVISNLKGVSGSDISNYDDSGNGILDVLHREFHEYEKTHGAITNIEFVDGNLIITYETPEGEKQEIIPISELIVLDDYYKKEETDALLDEKLDVSAYTDISDQVSANTENIADLTDVVDELSDELSAKTDLSLFNALVERLGYTDNETLERNNEHEVAFGSYNISNTDSDVSGQTIFSVGIGTSDEDRKNALEIRKNGDVYLWIEGDFMNINKLLAQIAHEVYDADSTNHSHFFDGE